MSDLIILRLYPAKPMAPSDFTTVLSGLKVTAYDLTFADSVGGVELGFASTLADPHLGSTTNNHVDITSTQLLQHYIDVTDPLGVTTRELESVATAVIVVETPAGHTEYPTPTSFDLRLELTKGGFDIAHRRLHYNADVTTLPSLSTNQKVYFGRTTSAYVTLPGTAGLDPNLAIVDLPADGQPPAFAQMVRAIDTVLADDPGGANATLVGRSPLTLAESRRIAAEIVWNRTAYPPPEPDPRLGLDPFGALYTDPPAEDTLNAGDIEKARARFEAELNGYYGTHDAEALRLAGFVYSASAAVAQEVLSIRATRARFDFPLITDAAPPTTTQTAGVALVENDGLTPAFVVPAAYFYALGAQMPGQVGPQQRFDMARFALEPQVLSAFETAADGGVITVPAVPTTVSVPAVAATQAARRLRALGAAENTLTEVPLVAPVEGLVTRWLAHTGPSATLTTDFWVPEVTAQPGPYLELLLQGVTANSAALIAAIEQPPLNVTTVAGLVAMTEPRWRGFFAANPALLPDFTAPGTPAERTEAFIRHLRTFLDVKADPGGGAPPVVGPPPELPRSNGDVFEDFMSAYPVYSGGVEFSFATASDPGAVVAAVLEVLPDDPAAQRWLLFALNAIRELWVVTDIDAGELRFSLIEALYARGFTAAARIAALSRAGFRYALSGTVAYGYAIDIYEKATSEQPEQPWPPGPFDPVNPNGSLVDCRPPEHLSPLGPIAYLNVPRVSGTSTWADPEPPVIQVLVPGPAPEGMELLGTPQADAQPSWLAPLRLVRNADDDDGEPGNGNGDEGGNGDVPVEVRSVAAEELAPADRDRLPRWIQTAARLGNRFVRVAAAGTPPAAAGFTPCDDSDACCGCGGDHEPQVDEYYFWLERGLVYEPDAQSADTGRGDEIHDRHRPDELPGLRRWPAVPVVHLCWSRKRGGRFEPQRWSGRPVRVQSAARARLEFTGRTMDSLRFRIVGGLRPTGYDADRTPPGFRYDLAADTATTVPLIAPKLSVGGLAAYPFFAYVCPGAPPEPLSLFSVALTVGAALRSHFRYEPMVKWYEPGQRHGVTDNTWTTCRRISPPTDGDGGKPDDDDSDGVVTGTVGTEGTVAVGRSYADVACCSTVVDDRRARERVLLRYLETMHEWADALLRRSTPESMRRADVVLAEIDRILGGRPQTVPGRPRATSW
ncbi:hypothetical protein [Nocardia lijiangensis]|uniref:hypothetical protein n=1 Tax=Nocardia lijiangensis TaxID=299618 RepID=UPI0008331F9B|nr:hypothetical protein [Nocardia lijiangensis]